MSAAQLVLSFCLELGVSGKCVGALFFGAFLQRAERVRSLGFWFLEWEVEG